MRARIVPLLPCAALLVAVAAGPVAAAGGGGSGSEKPTVLVLGDSIGQGYALGLERQGDFTVINAASVNCSLVTTGKLQSYRNAATPDGTLPQACDNWRTEWPALVDQNQPDIVLVVTGGWEIVNRWFGDPVGPAATLRDKEFRDAFGDASTEAADLLSAGGADVVFTTSWHIDPPRAQPYQEVNPTVYDIWWEPYGPDDPPPNWVPPVEGQEFIPAKEKIDRLNKVKATVGKKTDATTINVAKFVSPDNEYVDTIEGVFVRDADLSHFNEDGNDIIAEFIAPKLKKIAASNN